MSVRYAIALAGAIGITAAMPDRADAAFFLSYAYSRQTVSNMVFSTPTAAVTVQSVSSTTFNTALNAGGAIPSGADAHAGTTDAALAYVGPLANPPQNDYDPFGQTDPDYSRGDAIINSTSGFSVGGLRASNVAESYITDTGTGNGIGQWSVAIRFNVSAATDLFVSFDYLNEILLEYFGAAGALTTASFNLSFSLVDLTTNTQIGAVSPIDVNDTHSLLATGSFADMRVGTLTGVQINTFNNVVTSLTPNGTFGGRYQLTITGVETVSTELIPGVPEPATLASGILGLLLVAGLARRRANRPS